jgi:predicted GNAT family acetyltransferase
MDIFNNKKQFRFEHTLPDGEIITLDYRWLKGSMALMHTVVPISARGSGKGSDFIKSVLDYTRASGLKIIPYCSFVVQYIKDHPEYADLLDEAHRS